MTIQESPSHQALQQAAEWFATLRSSENVERDRKQWQAWLDQHEEHRAAWRYVESVSQRFAFAREDHADRTALRALETVRKRRRTLGIIAATACGSLLAWASWQNTPLRRLTLARLAQYRTGVGEIENLLLPDGTRVWINTASALNVHYSVDVRRLELVAGEILIETAHDSARRFVVDAGPNRMTALGTRFAVRLSEAESLLVVYDGSVALDTAERRQVVGAGEQISFGKQGNWQLEPASRAREAWANGVLLAENIPLGDLVDELKRYVPGHIGISSEAARLLVVGGFPLRDPDQTLALLEDALPIQVKRVLPWWINIELRAVR